MLWFNLILGLNFIFSPNLFQTYYHAFLYHINWPFFSKRTIKRNCKFAYGQSDHIYISLE